MLQKYTHICTRPVKNTGLPEVQVLADSDDAGGPESMRGGPGACVLRVEGVRGASGFGDPVDAGNPEGVRGYSGAGGPGCAAGRPGCSFEGYGGGPGGQYKHNRPDSHRVTVQSWPGNGGSHWVTGVPRWRYRHRRVSQKCVVSATEGGEGVIGVGSAVSELT